MELARIAGLSTSLGWTDADESPPMDTIFNPMISFLRSKELHRIALGQVAPVSLSNFEEGPVLPWNYSYDCY